MQYSIVPTVAWLLLLSVIRYYFHLCGRRLPSPSRHSYSHIFQIKIYLFFKNSQTIQFDIINCDEIL